ncbi:hypothetical protein FKM82_028336 [Ascaphus truei]
MIWCFFSSAWSGKIIPLSTKSSATINFNVLNLLSLCGNQPGGNSGLWNIGVSSVGLAVRPYLSLFLDHILHVHFIAPSFNVSKRVSPPLTVHIAAGRERGLV